MSVRRPPNSMFVSIVRNRFAARDLNGDAAVGAEEARAVDDVGASVDERRKQLRVFRGIELEVRVLDQQHVTGREREPEAHRGALSRG